MGRFYRTANSMPIDFMYRDNTPLMAQVLGANDQYIDQELDQSGKVGAFTFNYAPGDEAGATQLMNDYHTQANDITDAINKDPANWRKQQNGIRDLTKRLQSDYTSGSISKYLGNYNTRKTLFDNIDAQTGLYNKTGGVDKNGNAVGINPVAAQLYKNYADRNFKGTKNPDGTYNAYQNLPIMNDIDVAGRLGSIVSKMKDDGYSFTNEDITKGGEYFNSVTHEKKGLTPERILNELNDRVQSDPLLKNYLGQRQTIGEISGVKMDQSGNLVSPIQYSPTKITPEQEQQINSARNDIMKIKDPSARNAALKNFNSQVDNKRSALELNWDNSNYLTPIMRGVMNQYSHTETKDGNKLSNNSLYNTKFTQGQENNRFFAGQTENAREFGIVQKGINDRFAEAQALEREALARVGSKSSSKKGSKDDLNDDAPITDQFSSMGMNNLAGLTEPDHNNPSIQYPLFSAAGMANRIKNLNSSVSDAQNQINVLDKEIQKGYDNSDPRGLLNFTSLVDKRNNLKKQLLSTNSSLENARNNYTQTEQAVLSNDELAGVPLDVNTISLYKKFIDNGDYSGNKMKARIEQLRKNNPDVPMSGREKTTFTHQGKDLLNSMKGIISNNLQNKDIDLKPSPVVEAAQNELNAYYDARRAINNNKDNYLKNLSKSYIKSDAVTPSISTSNAVWNTFITNPKGSILYDNQGHNLTDTDITGNGFGPDWITGTKYSKNFEGDRNLRDYIHDNNVKVRVEKVGSTVDIGNGAGGLKVTFDDPNGRLKSTPYYISLSNEANSNIGNIIKSSTDPNISSVGGEMLNDDANDIKNQYASGKNTIIIHVKGKDIPVQIERLDNGKVAATMQVRDKDGNITSQPFPRAVNPKTGDPIGGINPVFNNIDELIQHKQTFN